jgi:hypothetical protein
MLTNGIAQCVFDRRAQSRGEGAVAVVITAHLNRFDDYRTDVFGAAFEIVEAAADFRDTFLFWRYDQVA